MRLSKSDLIELKVLNKLPKQDEDEFNKLMDNDSTFAKDYVIVQNLAAYVADEKLMNFRSQLESIQTQYEHKEKTKVITLTNTWRYAAAVAAVLLISFGSYFLMNQNESTNELFDKYYQLDDVYLNTRSGNAVNSSVLEQGLVLFERDEYQESINYFEQLPNSITAIYYSGVAHMELGEYDVATYKFNKVIDNFLNVFYDQATWYKSLCLIKQDKSRDAHEILQEISKTDSYYKSQAKELLKELDN